MTLPRPGLVVSIQWLSTETQFGVEVANDGPERNPLARKPGVVFKKLFRQPAADTQMEFGSSKLDTSIRSEYMEQVLGQLKRFGIPPDMVMVEIGEAGLSDDGHPKFHAMLRIVAWQRKPGVRLLLGLPLLEHSIRKALEATWLHEVSQFGGVWLQPSGLLDGGVAGSEIRGMIQALEAIGSAPAAPAAQDPPARG